MTGKMLRVLHYLPDPASGARYPIAALAKLDDGVHVVLPPHVPSDTCLGGPGRERFVHRIRQRLLGVSSIDRVQGLGPYCELSDPVKLQGEASLEFVKHLVADWHLAPSSANERYQVSRKAEGTRWFAANHVDQYVCKNFRPGIRHGSFLGHAAALESVSHYVPGVESLLLLEPLVLRPKIDEDIRRLALRFGAYSAALSSSQGGPGVEMIVYALPGVSDDMVGRASSGISFTSAKVVSVSKPSERTGFLDRIRAVASQALPLH